MNSRLRKIRALVAGILIELSIKKPPIPIEKIAFALGAELRYEPFRSQREDVYGMLFKEGSRSIIGVNSEVNVIKQRLIIAHEIGHLVLHEKRIYLDTFAEVFLRDNGFAKSHGRSEVDANRFGMELLMPARMLEYEFRAESVSMRRRLGSIPDILLVENLASRFAVSEQIMAFGLAQAALQS